MYTYNKNDKSYTFSFDELDINSVLNSNESEDDNTNNSHKKIEVINGGNDLDISPVTNYIEVEKPKNEKKENIIIPENNQ